MRHEAGRGRGVAVSWEGIRKCPLRNMVKGRGRFFTGEKKKPRPGGGGGGGGLEGGRLSVVPMSGKALLIRGGPGLRDGRLVGYRRRFTSLQGRKRGGGGFREVFSPDAGRESGDG